MKFKVLLFFCAALFVLVLSSSTRDSSLDAMARVKKLSRAKQLRSAIARVKKRQLQQRTVTSAPQPTVEPNNGDVKMSDRPPVTSQSGVVPQFFRVVSKSKLISVTDEGGR